MDGTQDAQAAGREPDQATSCIKYMDDQTTNDIRKSDHAEHLRRMGLHTFCRDVDWIDRQRRCKPSMVMDFLRNYKECENGENGVEGWTKVEGRPIHITSRFLAETFHFEDGGEPVPRSPGRLPVTSFRLDGENSKASNYNAISLSLCVDLKVLARLKFHLASIEMRSCARTPRYSAHYVENSKKMNWAARFEANLFEKLTKASEYFRAGKSSKKPMLFIGSQVRAIILATIAAEPRLAVTPTVAAVAAERNGALHPAAAAECNVAPNPAAPVVDGAGETKGVLSNLPVQVGDPVGIATAMEEADSVQRTPSTHLEGIEGVEVKGVGQTDGVGNPMETEDSKSIPTESKVLYGKVPISQAREEACLDDKMGGECRVMVAAISQARGEACLDDKMGGQCRSTVPAISQAREEACLNDKMGGECRLTQEEEEEEADNSAFCTLLGLANVCKDAESMSEVGESDGVAVRCGEVKGGKQHRLVQVSKPSGSNARASGGSSHNTQVADVSRPGKRGMKRHRGYVYWTEAETAAARDGFKRFGPRWNAIKQSQRDILKDRSEVDIKDKIRNLEKFKDKPRRIRS